MADELGAYQQAFYRQMGERFEAFQQMRSMGAAFRADGAVITTTRAAAERVFQNPEIYSSRFGPICGAHRPLIPIEIDPPDTLDAGHEWLVRNLPADAPTGLSWGDSRFANVMFSGTDVVSIFDWDTVSLAGAGADLAWWRTMDGPSSALPGIGSPDELTQRWQELTGVEVTNTEYYDVLTSFRLAAILMRLFSQMGAAGTLPPEVAQQQARESQFVQLLASQLEVWR